MQQIADWLEKLGTSEHAQRFVENHTDFSVLPDLTDHDLEKLGVLLGDRLIPDIFDTCHMALPRTGINY
jgi:SAM domain (Sterile alpha motif)